MSEKIQKAIDKLSKMNPLVNKILESVSVVEDISLTERAVANDQLIEDNTKLKGLVVELSRTITNMEDIISDITEDLEELRDSEDLSLSDDARSAIDDIVEKSSLSYLLQVYRDKQSMDSISKSARPYLCIQLIDKFESQDKGSIIPKLWRTIAGTNG